MGTITTKDGERSVAVTEGRGENISSRLLAGSQHDQCLPAAQPLSAMVRVAAADRPIHLFRVRCLSDATKPELLVDVRSHPFTYAWGSAGHRHRAGNALHPPC